MKLLALIACVLIGLFVLFVLRPNPVRLPSSEEVTWFEAEELMRSGNVVSAIQTHDRSVLLWRADGIRHHTVEPRLDDILKLAREIDPSGQKIGIGTE